MMPGPMFAVTVAKSYQSPLAGISIALGHTIVEIPLILLIYFGFARFFEHNMVQLILSILGGTVLIWLGITTFRIRTKVFRQGRDVTYNPLVAGVVTSILNPFFILWWATIGSMLIMNSLEFGVCRLCPACSRALAVRPSLAVPCFRRYLQNTVTLG